MNPATKFYTGLIFAVIIGLIYGNIQAGSTGSIQGAFIGGLAYLVAVYCFTGRIRF